jgi:hypothetical protein
LEDGKYTNIEFTLHEVNDSQSIPLAVGSDGAFSRSANVPEGLYVGKVTFLIDVPPSQKASRGNVSGMVVGPGGIVISDSKVTLSSGDTVRVDATDQDGRFFFPLLSPGTYRLLIEESNHAAGEIKEVHVAAGKTSLIRISVQATGSVEKVAATTLAVDVRSFIFPLKLTSQSLHQALFMKFGERTCGLDQEYAQMDTDSNAQTH